jgi:hypothetical protein
MLTLALVLTPVWVRLRTGAVNDLEKINYDVKFAEDDTEHAETWSQNGSRQNASSYGGSPAPVLPSPSVYVGFPRGTILHSLRVPWTEDYAERLLSMRPFVCTDCPYGKPYVKERCACPSFGSVGGPKKGTLIVLGSVSLPQQSSSFPFDPLPDLVWSYAFHALPSARPALQEP